MRKLTLIKHPSSVDMWAIKSESLSSLTARLLSGLLLSCLCRGPAIGTTAPSSPHTNWNMIPGNHITCRKLARNSTTCQFAFHRVLVCTASRWRVNTFVPLTTWNQQLIWRSGRLSLYSTLHFRKVQRNSLSLAYHQVNVAGRSRYNRVKRSQNDGPTQLQMKWILDSWFWF